MRISLSTLPRLLLGVALAAAPLCLHAQENKENKSKQSERRGNRAPRSNARQEAQPARSERQQPRQEAVPHVQPPRPEVRQVGPRSDSSPRTFGTRQEAGPNHAPRRVEVARPGGARVVSSAPGHGYVQRNVVVHNTTIIKRTYVYNGAPQVRIYRPYVYRGVSLAVYTPVRYYHPAFYAYVYRPWPRPIVFSWGWNSRPWYGYYGGYFTPYPAYSSPVLWLTDFFLAATLEAAYDERVAAAPAYAYAADPQNVPMSPAVKQAIADEVHRQIEQERAEQAAYGAPPPGGVFSDGGAHVFVVYNALNVNSSVGGCLLGGGDVLRTDGVPPEGSPTAAAMVLASRGSDCPRGSTVWVEIADLQEMQNQMRATVDRGMADLQARQGQDGLPQLPPGSAGSIDSPLAAEAQPDPDAAQEVQDVARQQGADPEPRAPSVYQPAGPTPTLSLGMSLDQVRAIQGDPEKIVDLGARQIYVYKDLKITFTDGKVSDIQ